MNKKMINYHQHYQVGGAKSLLTQIVLASAFFYFIILPILAAVISFLR